MQGAWKVGLLVVIFLALLVAAYQILGRALFAAKTDSYFAEMPDATGVNQGGPVLMAGVRVGSVKKITLSSPRLARLELSVDADRPIPEGTKAVIPSTLFGFGENPVMLVPPEREGVAFLQPGSTIPGIRASALDSAFPELKTTLNELNQTLISARDVFGDEKLRKNFTVLLERSSDAVDKLGRLADNMQGVLSENRASIRTAMNSLASAMRDVQEGARLAAEMLKDDRWKGKAETLLTQLSETARQAQELMTSLNDAVTDPQIRDPLRATAANVQAITESGVRSAQNAEEITKNGITISRNVDELTRKSIELADQAKDVLTKIQNFFERVPTPGRVSGIGSEMSLIRQEDPSHWRTDLSISVPVSSATVYAGIYDAFEGNKIILQYGKPLNGSVAYRYGIYASKPSVGVDWEIARRLNLRSDLYNINKPTLDMRLRYDFGDDLIGWAGFERIFDRNSFAVGIGIKK